MGVIGDLGSSVGSQQAFTAQLQNAFATNNAQQQGQLDFLNNKLQSTIDNPSGYSPATLAAMRAQANDQVASENQNVQRNVNSTFATRGGAAALPGGVEDQVRAAVGAQSAQAGNNAQQDITEQNANLQEQNQQAALREELGVAQTENPEGMAGAANQGASVEGELANDYTKDKGPGIGSVLGTIAGGVAGSFLGPMAGGVGSSLGKSIGSNL